MKAQMDTAIPPLPDDIDLPPLPEHLPFPLRAESPDGHAVELSGSISATNLSKRFVEQEETQPSDTDEQGLSSDGDDEGAGNGCSVAHEARRRLKSSVPMPELRQAFSLPRAQAARALSMSVNCLKRLCRKRGIERWPYRKLMSLDNLAAALRGQPASQPQQQQALLAAIERERCAVLDDPSHEVDAWIARHRTTTYKQRYVVRKRGRKHGTAAGSAAAHAGDHDGGSAGSDGEQDPHAPARHHGPAVDAAAARVTSPRSCMPASVAIAGQVKREAPAPATLLRHGSGIKPGFKVQIKAEPGAAAGLASASQDGLAGGSRGLQGGALIKRLSAGAAGHAVIGTASEPGLCLAPLPQLQPTARQSACQRRTALLSLLGASSEQGNGGADRKGGAVMDVGTGEGPSQWDDAGDVRADLGAGTALMSVSGPNTTEEEEGELQPVAAEAQHGPAVVERGTSIGPSAQQGTRMAGQACRLNNSPLPCKAEASHVHTHLLSSPDAPGAWSTGMGLASNVLAITEMQLLAASQAGQELLGPHRQASQRLMESSPYARPGDWSIPTDLAAEVFLDTEPPSTADLQKSSAGLRTAAPGPHALSAAAVIPAAAWGKSLPNVDAAAHVSDPLAAALPGAKQSKCSGASPDAALTQQLGSETSMATRATNSSSGVTRLHAFLASTALQNTGAGAATAHQPPTSCEQSVGPQAGAWGDLTSMQVLQHASSSQSCAAIPGSGCSLPEWAGRPAPESGFTLPTMQMPYAQFQQQGTSAAVCHPAFLPMSDPGLRPPAPASMNGAMATGAMSGHDARPHLMARQQQQQQQQQQGALASSMAAAAGAQQEWDCYRYLGASATPAVQHGVTGHQGVSGLPWMGVQAAPPPFPAALPPSEGALHTIPASAICMPAAADACAYVYPQPDPAAASNSDSWGGWLAAHEAMVMTGGGGVCEPPAALVPSAWLHEPQQQDQQQQQQAGVWSWTSQEQQLPSNPNGGLGLVPGRMGSGVTRLVRDRAPGGGTGITGPPAPYPTLPIWQQQQVGPQGAAYEQQQPLQQHEMDQMLECMHELLQGG